MGAVLNILTSEILQSAPNDTKLNLNDLTEKYPTYGVRVPKFHLCHSTISCFPYTEHFVFPIDSHVEISKRHIFFKTWLISKNTCSLYSPMVCSPHVNFGQHWMKTVGAVVF